MKTHHTSFLLAALLGVALAPELHAQNAAFTYQGRLNDGPSPANGPHDLRFALFNASSGGSPIGGPLTNSAVAVSNGLFTVLFDFDTDFFTGQDLWLDIAVRPAGVGAFIPLNPRQPITPTPYALTALNALNAGQATTLASGVVSKLNNLSNNVTLTAGQNVTITPSGNTLTIDASGLNPWQINGSNVFYNAGNVGVGTTTPQEKLDIRSGGDSFVRVDSVNGDIRVNGGTDGHFGFFNDGLAAGGTHLIGQGQSRLFVGNAGNVGIGTATPLAKLDVRGDIRMGTSGEVRAAGGEENLRIVRGTVNAQGGIVRGAGFNVVHAGQGDYGITFIPPFAGPPVLTVSVEYDGNSGVFGWFARPDGTTASSSGMVVSYLSNAGTGHLGDHTFHFTAIGPR